MNVVSIVDPLTVNGTILWIGDICTAEFREPMTYCLEQAPQLAIRANAAEALRRPASGVSAIVFARDTRLPVNHDDLNDVRRCYPSAIWVDLLGPLSAGLRESSLDDAKRLPWHRWEQVLPGWFENTADQDQDERRKARSVAIVAATLSAAEAYLDLAEGCGATAVWCRHPASLPVRNIDAVWWDDSASSPVTSATWQQRLASFGSVRQFARHAWITNSSRLDQQQAALQGGVEVVLQKPCRIDPLIEMIESEIVEKTSRMTNRRRSA